MNPFAKYLISLLTITCTGSVFAQPVADTAKGGRSHSFTPRAPIRDQDVLWRKTVWRVISLTDSANRVLSATGSAASDNSFPNVLLKGIRTGEIMAYEKDMSTVMPKAKLDSEYAQQVAYYGIKEEWIFDRNQGQMAVHILALTPMVADSGSYKELFWLVYPDNTLFLSQHVVQNANNKANGMTWDAYFESRLFSSRITRIDHDKPANKKRKAEVIEDVTGLQELRQTWPKD